MTYGDLPEDLGLIDLSPVEMMAWLYCPVATPAQATTLPDNLAQFWPILNGVMAREPERYTHGYVYLTAKTLWVEGSNIANRPGWHSDGFGTDDVNFIWYDRAPTEFLRDSFELPEDCTDAMAVMAARARRDRIVTLPDKHLLRLTPAVVHRSPVVFEPGMRTFVKVSLSPDRYNLEGNSINHGILERWPLVQRAEVRNHPHAAVRNADSYAG